MLIMSNDMVLPYDVTTKDDIFYSISCNYNETPEKEKERQFIEGVR